VDHGSLVLSGVEFVDARTLLTPRRLDYVVKYRFFRHLMSGDDPDSERVYRWHILKRTGGNEPRSHKRTVHDYVSACRELLASIGARGFDPAHVVKIGRNGLIVGSGAHRVACCAALGTPIAVIRIKRRGKHAWDFEWFWRHGMVADDLDRLSADRETLRGRR
jgi:hypothetical protein